MENLMEKLKNLTKQQKIIAAVIAAVAVIAVVVVIVLLAMGGSAASNGGVKDYTVEVKTEGGIPMEKVEVYVYEDNTLNDLLAVGKTDENGVYTFSAEWSDKYVVVLKALPAGYNVDASYKFTTEKLSLSLKASLLSASAVTKPLKLGAVAADMTITTADGKSYTISELLKSKKAVVLNFWYEGCQPCKAEFPYMEEAYKQYSDKLEILAVNTYDGDDASVAAYKANLGLSFPMAKADGKFATVFNVSAYPTTVVIDRYGTIGFLHTGTVPSTESFTKLFDYFTSDSYVQSTIRNLDDLVEKVEGGDGSKANPFEEYETEFEAEVAAGKEVYYQMFKVDGMKLEIADPDAYVLFDDKKYEAVDGKVSLILKTEDTYTPAVFAIGNKASADKKFTVKLSFVPGSQGAPFTMELGDFVTNIAAGNEAGVYYTYTATENGTVTLQCTAVTSGVKYDYSLYNTSSSALRNLSSDNEGDNKVSIAVNAGDIVQISIGVLPNEDNEIPAAEFNFRASFVAGEGTGIDPNATIEYTVTVKDNKGNAISGVAVKLNQDITITTDANGVAKTTLPKGNYIVVVNAPSGYKADATEYIMTQYDKDLVITLEKTQVVSKTYTIKVVDESGNAIAGANVSLGGQTVKTDASGNASFTLEEGNYTANVGASGYEVASKNLAGATSATVTLKKESATATKVTYTVTVVDYKGRTSVIKNVNVQFKLGDAVVEEVKIDSKGKATVSLNPGTYTAVVADATYGSGTVTLTAAAPNAELMAAKRTSDTQTLGDVTATVIKVGATYVNINPNGDNYFIFTPSKSAKYRIKTNDSNAKIAFCGSTEHAILSPVYGGNAYEWNVLEDQIGHVVCLVSVTGTTDGIILVENLGAADKPIQYTEYTGSGDPADFTLSGTSGSKHQVDITASSFDIVYNETDGYYHKGSANGPIVYVTLGSSAQYISMKDLVDKTGLKSASKKEDYTPLMLKYVNAMDETTGVYPLTEDLKYMFQNAGEEKGWWDKNTTTGVYLFGDKTVNTAIAWMFECVYWE